MDQSIKPLSRKFILGLLADQARDCGHVWPAVKTLARYCELDPRSIRAHLTKLQIEDEVLSKIQQFRDNGSQTSNLYLLPIPNRESCPEECRGFGLDMTPATVHSAQASLELGGVDADTNPPVDTDINGGLTRVSGEPLTRASGQRTISKNPKKKQSESIDVPIWAEPLKALSLFQRDPATEKWFEDVAQGFDLDWLKWECKSFVEYYGSPKTRTLKSWKSSLRNWLKIARAKDPEAAQGSIDMSVRHDPAKDRGDCPCNWCKNFTEGKS